MKIYYTTTKHEFIKPGMAIVKYPNDKYYIGVDEQSHIIKSDLKKWLRLKWISGNKNEMNQDLANISKIVCDYEGLEETNVLNGCKKGELVEARQLISFFGNIKLKNKKKLYDIAEFINKDRTTVMAAIKRISDLLDVDKTIQLKVKELSKKIIL